MLIKMFVKFIRVDKPRVEQNLCVPSSRVHLSCPHVRDDIRHVSHVPHPRGIHHKSHASFHIHPVYIYIYLSFYFTLNFYDI